MKIQQECVPCLFKRILFEIDQSTTNKKTKDKAMKAAAEAFSQVYSQDSCSAVIATHVHKATYHALNDNDPYKNLKEASNTIAQKLVPTVENMVKSSNDPLRTSILCAIVGNALDFGIEGGSSHPEVLVDQFHDLITEGLGHDDYEHVQDFLKKSHRILYFTDNCGEIVFDKIVCRELKKHYPTLHITLVVKGTAVLSDATLEDAEALGFHEVVDEILTTGCYAVGLDFSNLPDKLNHSLESTDLIICKGMANYEVFSETEYHPIIYFLRSKCAPIAQSMNVPLHKNIIKVYP